MKSSENQSFLLSSGGAEVHWFAQFHLILEANSSFTKAPRNVYFAFIGILKGSGNILAVEKQQHFWVDVSF